MLIDKKAKSTIIKIVSIFETGTPSGDYGNVSLYHDGPNEVLQITYGSQQTTEYGHLPELLRDYVESNGKYADKIKPFIETLGKGHKPDPKFIALLKKSGDDTIMHACQDELFEDRYWSPSVKWCDANGFTLPLSALVIYDSYIHSGRILDFLRQKFIERPPAYGGDEKEWIKNYVEARYWWLKKNVRIILQSTVYRPLFFKYQFKTDNWMLDKFPMDVNGVKLSS